LVTDVLPEAREQAPKLAFRTQYQAEYKRIFDRLKAGDRLSPQEMAIIQQLAAKPARQPDQQQQPQTSDPWEMAKNGRNPGG